MSNKDLLKLENEYRGDLPKYKEKPRMSPMKKPELLTKRVSDFLETANKVKVDENEKKQSDAKSKINGHVEFDICLIGQHQQQNGH